MKRQTNFKEQAGRILLAIFTGTLLLAPFRIYSTLYGIASSTSPRVSQDLAAPFDQPLLKTSSRIDLERDLPGEIVIDLGTLVTGELRGWNRLNIPEGASVLIAHQDTPIDLHFNFSQFKSLGGHWRSTGVRLMMTGALDETLRGEAGRTQKDWGGVFGVSSSLDRVSPDFSVVVPVNEVDLLDNVEDRRIAVTVEMDIEYPSFATSASYEDREGTLTHSFYLTVLTPEELSEYQAVRKEYMTSQTLRVLLIWFVILAVEYVLVFRHRIAEKLRAAAGKSPSRRK